MFILNKTILNILSDFSSQETFTVEDKDPIVNSLQSNVYKSYLNSKNSNNSQYLRGLKILQEDLCSASKVIFQ